MPYRPVVPIRSRGFVEGAGRSEKAYFEEQAATEARLEREATEARRRRSLWDRIRARLGRG
ncbi:MAG TPA: hypothetical protein VF484_02055 [Candidatus Limnocylindrales bacterium]